MAGEIINEDGTTQQWGGNTRHRDAVRRLRAGMYRDGRGTWFNRRYQLDHPSSYNLEYTATTAVDLIPPPRRTPTTADGPALGRQRAEWLIRRMSGLAPEQPGTARFGSPGSLTPSARRSPLINRPDLEVEEQDRLLDYLDAAPLVVFRARLRRRQARGDSRGHRAGRVPQRRLWIWPAAVNFYPA